MSLVTASSNDTMICASCGSSDATRRCTRCKDVVYCNTTCQKADWKEHKKICKRKEDDNDVSILPEDVSINLRDDYDDRGEFYAFTSISVVISVKNENAGSMKGVLISRNQIPPGLFLTAMDGHSHELQMVSNAVFEPGLGRTKLISLSDGGDNHKMDILYVESINIKDKYKDNSNVGAFAIRKLLRHKIIKGNKSQGGIWCGISSCVYILEPEEGMPKDVREKYEADENEREEKYSPWYRDEEETVEAKAEREEADKQRQLLRNKYARVDAIKFLRNGFYQDKAAAKEDSYIIMAATDHWQVLQSESKAANVKLLTSEDLEDEIIPSPSGKDNEILEVTKRICSSGAGNDDESAGKERSILYTTEVSPLLAEGGSLVKAHALHAACALDDVHVAKTILEMDPDTLESRDIFNVTPLIAAASHMAGKANNRGFPQNHPIIDLLLDAGADTNAEDSRGLTAYGLFKARHRSLTTQNQAIIGTPALTDEVWDDERLKVRGQAEIERKLLPSEGMTHADITYGENRTNGYIEFDNYDSDYDDY